MYQCAINPPGARSMKTAAYDSNPILQLYFQELWQRVALIANGRPIAIFGASPHTNALLQAASTLPNAPQIVAILSDAPKRPATIAGIQVQSTDDVDPAQYAAAVISSDTIQESLLKRALQWALTAPEATRPKIISMYNGISIAAPTPRPASLIESTPRPIRERTDGTIEPQIDNVMELETPEFSVCTMALKSEVASIFKRHQIYPGDARNPADDLRDVDFATHFEQGLITKDTRVSVIGSCFAIRFKKWLVDHGFNFCQYETGPLSFHGSVRAGPIFNTSALRQFIEWSYDGFNPAEKYWNIKDRLFDPYRKRINWPDERSAVAERDDHFANSRRMFEHTQVLVVTLGLSELWRSKVDGSSFFQFPPTEILDLDRHEHTLLTVEENLHNLNTFYERLKSVNPDIRLVISLSPVPLLATHFDRHAVVSDAVSKATLRTTLHWFCQQHPEIIYFPSYEIVTRMPDWPFVKDNRHIKGSPIVERVMDTFMRHYGEPTSPIQPPVTDEAAAASPTTAA